MSQQRKSLDNAIQRRTNGTPVDGSLDNIMYGDGIGSSVFAELAALDNTPTEVREVIVTEYVEVPAPIYQNEGYTVIGKFAMSSTGLAIADDVTQDEWAAFAGWLNAADTALQWIIADWLVRGDVKQWFTYEEISRKFLPRLTPDTLKQYAHVGRNIDPLIRINGQDFAIAQYVASLNIPDHKKEEYLQLAADEKLSVSKLRLHIEGTLPPSKTPGWQKRLDALEGAYTKRAWSKMSTDSRRRAYERLQSLLQTLEKWGLE